MGRGRELNFLSLNLYILYLFDYCKDLRCDLTNQFFFLNLHENELYYFDIAKVLYAKFDSKIAKRECFCQKF